jgi:hypothetical protein
MLVTGFPGTGVFGSGTNGLQVTRVVAISDGGYGISRFVSTRTLFAHDVAIGNDEAGFYVGDSPDADTVVRDDQAFGNQFGIFVRHAREVLVTDNRLSGNCQGILVLDDGQPGGAGNAVITSNIVVDNNKFCPKGGDTPVNTQGGGILLLGATRTLVTHNTVIGNSGKQINSGGIVVASAKALPQPPRGSHLGWFGNRSAVPGQPVPDIDPGGTLPLRVFAARGALAVPRAVRLGGAGAGRAMACYGAGRGGDAPRLFGLKRVFTGGRGVPGASRPRRGGSGRGRCRSPWAAGGR